MSAIPKPLTDSKSVAVAVNATKTLNFKAAKYIFYQCVLCRYREMNVIRRRRGNLDPFL